MTVLDNYEPVKQLGNGVNPDFDFTWTVYDTTDVLVYLEDATTGIQTLQTETTDYAIVLDNDGEDGGTVTFVVTPTSANYVVLVRDVPYSQPTEYETSSGFQAKVAETSYDRNTILIQQVQDESERSLKFQAGASISDTTIQGDITATEKLITVDAGGIELKEIASVDSALDTILTSLQDEDILRYDAGSSVWRNEALSTTDELVKISSNDTTAGYVEDKFVAGTNTTITTNNGGGNETFQYNVPASSTTTAGVVEKATATETTNGTTGKYPDAELIKDTWVDNVFHAQDQKSNGTRGGDSATTGRTTRVINTVLTSQSWASLSSNQITLDAGTYRIKASSPAYLTNGHKLFLYNTSDSSDEIVGTSGYSASGAVDRSYVEGEFTIASSKTFELQHYTVTQQLLNGLGVNTGAGSVEIYSDIQIEKVG